MVRGFAPENDSSRSVVKALREAARAFESQLGGLSEQKLRWRASEDAWSLKEIAAHLRDCEEHFLNTLELIAYADSPRIPALDADALVLENDYRDCDLYETLERYEYARHHVVNLLWSLAPEDWERTGRHPYLGEVSIARLTREQTEHDLEHLWQARRLAELLATQTGTIS